KGKTAEIAAALSVGSAALEEVRDLAAQCEALLGINPVEEAKRVHAIADGNQRREASENVVGQTRALKATLSDKINALGDPYLQKRLDALLVKPLEAPLDNLEERFSKELEALEKPAQAAQPQTPTADPQVTLRSWMDEVRAATDAK